MQHQSKVTEGSAAIPATAQLQINSELSKANEKRKNISGQQTQAKRPALDTRRSDPKETHSLCAASKAKCGAARKRGANHLLCAAARQNV